MHRLDESRTARRMLGLPTEIMRTEIDIMQTSSVVLCWFNWCCEWRRRWRVLGRIRAVVTVEKKQQKDSEWKTITFLQKGFSENDVSLEQGSNGRSHSTFYSLGADSVWKNCQEWFCPGSEVLVEVPVICLSFVFRWFMGAFKEIQDFLSILSSCCHIDLH